MSRQRNRLKNAQKSLLEFKEKLIAEVTPTLEQTKDVEAAVSLARLQYSADRLERINKELEALVSGAKLDGQHDDALESVKEANRIMALLEIRLRAQNASTTSKEIWVIHHRPQEQ